MSDELHRRNAEAYVTASCAHDIEVIRPLLAEKVVYESANVGNFEGREAALAMMADFFALFPDVSWQVKSYDAVSADAVEFDFVLTATNSETGESVRREARERIEFGAEGSIIRIVVA